MPRKADELGPLAVSCLSTPGLHFVGGVVGLGLQVLPGGGRTWILRATARDHRVGLNPARWRGNLDKLLAKSSKVSRVTHHVALAIDDMPAFMTRLWSADGLAPGFWSSPF